MWLQLGLRDAVRMGGEGFCVSVGTLPRGRGIMFGRAPCAQFSAAQHCSLAVLDFGASRGRLVRGNRVGGAWSSRCGSEVMWVVRGGMPGVVVTRGPRASRWP